MKRYSLILFASILCSMIQVSASANDCFVRGVGGFCYFDSLKRNPGEHLYFHCNTPGTAYVKMYNHNVLISGFMPASGLGAGTLTMTGLGVRQMLDDYYFEVMDHKKHPGLKYVVITSLGPIKCSMGKGGRNAVFPGLFGMRPGQL